MQTKIAQEMQIIIQETQRLSSQNCINDHSNSRSGIQLLVKAYDRIRQLQMQNQQCQLMISQINSHTLRASQYQETINHLNSILKEKQLKIQNLQHLNKKMTLDYVKLQKQLLSIKKQFNFSQSIKKQTYPAELSSPLNISKFDKKLQTFQIPHVDVHVAKQYLVQQEVDQLNRGSLKFKESQNFTFNKQNYKERYRLSLNNSQKQLKNCLSHHEINRMLKKVNSRQQLKEHQNHNKMKQYVKYCSSIQKKFTKNSPFGKDNHLQLNMHKFQHKKSPSNCFALDRSKPFTPKIDKKWNDTSSTQATNPFNIFSQTKNKLTFY